MKAPRLQFRARLRVRALSLLAASVMAATVLTAAIAPALIAEAMQPEVGALAADGGGGDRSSFDRVTL